MKTLIAELDEIANRQAQLKRWAMVYQGDAKVTVAEHYGLPFEEVNLPFDDWMRLRRKYESETGKQL